MQIEISQIITSVIALAAGAAVGLGFGYIQEAAARKHQLQQSSGKLTNGWAIVPGSMRRTGYFLMTLAAVQLICPLLFSNGCQWWVSGGVAIGYGWCLYRKLRQSMALARGQ